MPPPGNVTDEKDMVSAPHDTVLHLHLGHLYGHSLESLLPEVQEKSDFAVSLTPHDGLFTDPKPDSGGFSLEWASTPLLVCHRRCCLSPLGREEFEGRVGDRRFLPRPH